MGMTDVRMIARTRLERLVPIEGFLATARGARPAIAKQARALAKGLSAGSDFASYTMAESTDRLARAVDREAPEQVELVELLSETGLREQVAAFARVGMVPFRASQRLSSGGVRERSAAGASTSVSGVVRSGGRLLMETQRLVVETAPDASERTRMDLFKRHGLIPIRSFRFGRRVDLVAVSEGGAIAACYRLLEDDAVVFAEPDLIEHIDARAPNDPMYRRQWHLENRGNLGGVVGADIRAPAAWARTLGDGMRIAVIDNGFDTRHRDLVFAQGGGWYRSTTGYDDADFVPGYGQMPDSDHGTACAGMATARLNNGRGGAGVAPGADLLAIACLGDQVGTQSTLARAIAYAADHSAEIDSAPAGVGADVIACSLGPNGAQWDMSATLSLAIDFATTQGRGGRGTPVFWAVTNGNFPIAFDEVVSHPNVIRVGRSTRRDADDGSGYGPELDFLAPGVDVHIAASGDVYASTTGTSFACPCAAAVGALALSRFPTLSPSELRAKLHASCDKVGNLPYTSGRNDRFGHGRINADRATI
jgi:thermitase